MRSLRIAIVGAGLAGLAAATAFRRSGHDVTVLEQADGLRASGLAINLWSNATSLLPAGQAAQSHEPGNSSRDERPVHGPHRRPGTAPGDEAGRRHARAARSRLGEAPLP